MEFEGGVDVVDGLNFSLKVRRVSITNVRWVLMSVFIHLILLEIVVLSKLLDQKFRVYTLKFELLVPKVT